MIRNETARLLRRTAPALATLPLALALSGCGTLTGLNAENDFSCPMTPGVSCRSLSDTYEDSVRGRTPDRIERDKAIEAASKEMCIRDSRKSPSRSRIKLKKGTACRQSS